LLDSSTVVDQQFLTLADAMTYFNDQVLTLPGTASTATFNVEVLSSTAGDSFIFDLEVAAVPEVSTTSMLLGGLLLLAGFSGLRKWRQRRVAEALS